MQKFAFLIHPRDTSDIARRFWFTKFLPPLLVDSAISKLSGRLGFSICSRFNVSKGVSSAYGYIIGIALNGKQMMNLPQSLVRKRIIQTVLYAQNKLKVNVVGLGALTTSVTDGGSWVAQYPDVKIAVTHGDTFTVIIAQQGIEKILKKYNFDIVRNRIAIVGAYGIIGREICIFLAKKGYKLILVESVPEKVDLIKKRIINEGLERSIIITSTAISSISSADLVIAATSHPLYLLRSEYLKKGVIVYDIAQPINCSPDVIKIRPDIVRIDGGYVDIGGIDLKFPMGPSYGSTFACFAETMMMAFENDNRNHVGHINKDFMNEVKMWGGKYHFFHAPFNSSGLSVDLK